MKKYAVERCLRWILSIIGISFFTLFSTLSPRADTIAIVFGAITVFLFIFFLLNGMRNFLNFFSVGMYNRRDELIGERTLYNLHPRKKIFALSLIAQIALIFAVYLISVAVNGYSDTVFGMYSKLFVEQNLYGIGDFANSAWNAFGLIPLPKLFGSLLSSLGLSSLELIIAFVFNCITVSCVCVCLYEVLILDYDRKVSVWGVIFLFISPSIAYLLMPYSGTAPFMLATLLFIYFMKTAQPIKGLICMLTAILINIMAVLLLVPFVLLSVKLFLKKQSSPTYCIILAIGIVITAIITTLLATNVIHVHGVELIYTKGFRFFFEGMGEAATRWNSYNSTATPMFFAIGAQLIALILLVHCAKRVDAAVNIFMMLWLALTPMAFSDPSMAVYSVCICPALPILIGASVKSTAHRLLIALIMTALTLLFYSVIFVFRLA